MYANGIILFDYAHTTPVYTNTLMAGAFNDGKKDKPVIVNSDKQKKKLAKEIEKDKEKKDNRRVITTMNSKGFWVFTK